MDDDDGQLCPLFPLETVLFPRMELSLHVFEDRYKRMLRDLREEGLRFGVVLIREGQEVGGEAEVFGVGTLARVVQVAFLPNGQFYLQTEGSHRFRIRRLVRQRPYLMGRIDVLPESPMERNEATQRLLDQVHESFGQYLDLLRRRGAQASEIEHAGLDPEALSWLVASTLAVPPPVHQRLLETEDPVTRLVLERRVLTELIEVLQRQVERSSIMPGLPFSTN